MRGSPAVGGERGSDDVAVRARVFVGGVLAAAARPPTKVEREKAQALMGSMPPVTEELSSTVKDVAEHLREPAREAATNVKEAASEAARDVAETAKQDVREAAEQTKQQAGQPST